MKTGALRGTEAHPVRNRRVVDGWWIKNSRGDATKRIQSGGLGGARGAGRAAQALRHRCGDGAAERRSPVRESARKTATRLISSTIESGRGYASFQRASNSSSTQATPRQEIQVALHEPRHGRAVSRRVAFRAAHDTLVDAQRQLRDIRIMAPDSYVSTDDWGEGRA